MWEGVLDSPRSWKQSGYVRSSSRDLVRLVEDYRNLPRCFLVGMLCRPFTSSQSQSICNAWFVGSYYTECIISVIWWKRGALLPMIGGMAMEANGWLGFCPWKFRGDEWMQGSQVESRMCGDSIGLSFWPYSGWQSVDTWSLNCNRRVDFSHNFGYRSLVDGSILDKKLVVAFLGGWIVSVVLLAIFDWRGGMWKKNILMPKIWDQDKVKALQNLIE